MELNLQNTLQNSIDTAIILRKLSGISKKNNNARRKMYIIFLLLSSILFILGFHSKVLFTAILSAVLILFSIINIIFANKINIYYYKRNVLKNYKIIGKQYNHNFLEPTNVKIKIENGYVEIESLDKITKYPLQDYVKYFKEERFHVFEFKNGKYIFINQEDLSDEKLKEFCKELENK